LAKWLWLVWALIAAQADAQPTRFQAGPIEVGDVRSAPTPPVASVGSVYLWITNHGAEADRLVAVESPLAAKAEIHLSTSKHGVMQMRELATIECPPGATVKIEPGALHIMLLGLKHPLVAGSTFPLSLTFRDAGILVVQVSVKGHE
jgi:copper(I)-binding protein